MDNRSQKFSTNVRLIEHCTPYRDAFQYVLIASPTTRMHQNLSGFEGQLVSSQTRAELRYMYTARFITKQQPNNGNMVYEITIHHQGTGFSAHGNSSFILNMKSNNQSSKNILRYPNFPCIFRSGLCSVPWIWMSLLPLISKS